MEKQTLLPTPTRRRWEISRFSQLFWQMKRELNGRTFELVKLRCENSRYPEELPFELELEDPEQKVVHVIPYALSRNFLVNNGYVTVTISHNKIFEYRGHTHVYPYQLLSIAQISQKPTQ